jgi:CubicO group peptidase (beta-lactamase class C family)
MIGLRRMPPRHRILALLIVTSILTASAARPARAQARAAGKPALSVAELDRYVGRALAELGQPGLAVAIVKDGQVVLARGYGVRNVETRAPVDAHTLFQIGSNTKAFTTAALAMLVDEGKLEWDDHVTDYLPWFQLADPYVTREFTIRDLLTHRSGLGLGAGDLLWLHSDYGREEIVRRLRTVKPVTSFRSAYAYDNVLYIAAGLVVEAVTHQSWDELVRTRFFTPLGMHEANTSVTAFRAGDNVADPYGRVNGKLQLVARDSVDNVGPAGAINANVTDLAKWLIAQLDSGRVAGPGDRRLWAAPRTREMWAAQTVTPIATPPAALAELQANFSAYGLGWGLRDFRGHKLVTHSGGLAGMISRTTLVPDQRLGVVVLTNGETPAAEAVAWKVVATYLGGSATDWIAGYKAAYGAFDAAADSVVQARFAARDTASKPSLPLAGYAGPYADAMYGDASIALEPCKADCRVAERLVLRFGHSPAFVGDLEHWQHDTFVARWRTSGLADAFVTFSLTADGTVGNFAMAPYSPAADFSFDYQDLLFRPALRPSARSTR